MGLARAKPLFFWVWKIGLVFRLPISLFLVGCVLHVILLGVFQVVGLSVWFAFRVVGLARVCSVVDIIGKRGP